MARNRADLPSGHVWRRTPASDELKAYDSNSDMNIPKSVRAMTQFCSTPFLWKRERKVNRQTARFPSSCHRRWKSHLTASVDDLSRHGG